MATLTELQTEFNSINDSIKALVKIKGDAGKAAHEAAEAAKSNEQKITELQEKIRIAKEFLAKLQSN